MDITTTVGYIDSFYAVRICLLLSIVYHSIQYQLVLILCVKFRKQKKRIIFCYFTLVLFTITDKHFDRPSNSTIAASSFDEFSMLLRAGNTI